MKNSRVAQFPTEVVHKAISFGKDTKLFYTRDTGSGFKWIEKIIYQGKTYLGNQFFLISEDLSIDEWIIRSKLTP